MTKKYFLSTNGCDYVEVTKEEWIRAERAAGFYPKIPTTDPRYMKVCATGGFASGYIKGTIKND